MKLVGLAICILAFVVSTHAQSAEIEKADSVASLYPGHSLDDLGILSYKLTASLSTDKGKFRAIYKWVCANIESDYELMEINKRKRAKLKGDALTRWNKAFNLTMIRILVDRHKTLCTGYAWLVRELALRAGIACEIVHGYGRSVRSNIGGTGVANHSWNAVQLNGQWYLCDPTWSSGGVTESNTFVPSFNDCYFLADPAYFILNHYPLDTTWALLENAPGLHTFLNAPLIYASAYDLRVRPEQPSTFRFATRKGQAINFSFINEMCQPLKMMVENKFVATDYAFPKRGVYAIHVVVDEKIVISYEVAVK